MKNVFALKNAIFSLFDRKSAAQTALVFALFAGVFASTAFSTDYYWVRTATGPGDWTDPTNWSLSESGSPLASTDPYPSIGDTAWIAGNYTVTIDEDIEVAALNIKKLNSAYYLSTSWTTQLTGSNKITFGSMDFNRAADPQDVIGRLVIDCDATCKNDLMTHSGTALVVNNGSTLKTKTLTHSAFGKTPKSIIEVTGTLTATGTIELESLAGCNALKVNSGGKVEAASLTWSNAEPYTNPEYDAINNSGTITLSGDLKSKGPVTNRNNGTIKATGDITFAGTVAGESGTITGASVSVGAADASNLGTVAMTADTPIKNTGAGDVTVKELSGNKTATLSNSSTGSIAVSTFDSSPKIEVASNNISLGTGTLAALTVNAGATATVSGNLTVTDDITNNGTLDASAAAAKITMTGATATFAGNATAANTKISDFVYAPSAANGNSLTVSGSNTFTKFTLDRVGGTLTVNAAQKITGDLTLKGSSGSPLNITGTGSLNIESNQSAGNYLSVAHTGTGPKITGGYYTAANSSFAAAPLYGQDKGWIFLDSPPEFVWTGTTDTDWGKPTNWNYNMVPGLTGSAGVPATVGYPVKIPDSPSGGNFPIAAAAYTVKSLKIGTSSGAKLELSSAANIAATAASGALENHGTIIYSNIGRVTNETGTFINDDAHGTVEFKGSGTGDAATKDLADVNYFNLTINGSGDFEANSTLTVHKNLNVKNGKVYFNNSSTGTATTAENATFDAGTSIWLGNNYSTPDTFTVTGALDFPKDLAALYLCGIITASGGITLSKNATLVGNVDFNSKITLDESVNIIVEKNHTTQTVTTNAELDCNGNTLTLTKACLKNNNTVTKGKIVFEEEEGAVDNDKQAFTPRANADTTYDSITINKAYGGSLKIQSALTATDFTVTKNGTLYANAALTVTTLKVDAGIAYFNNSGAATATKATTATFATTGTVSLGNTVGDSFTVTNGGITHTGPTRLGGKITTTDGSAINLGATSPNQATALAADTTIDAGTGDVTVNGTLTGAHALTFKGSGTLEFKKTVAATKVTMTGAAPKIKANGATILDLEYAPTDTSDTGLTVADENNTFTKFTCAIAEAKVTLDKANNFGTLNMTSGGGTLTVNAAPTVTTLKLEGTSVSPLNIKGTGSLNITSSQQSGDYLSVNPSGPKICNDSGDIYYSAKNSTFDGDPVYGEHNHWILMNSLMKFVWTGDATSGGNPDSAWSNPDNWNYHMVPGMADAVAGVSTTGYPVTIPDEPTGNASNFPIVSVAQGYLIGALSVGESVVTPPATPASLTISTTGNLRVTTGSALSNFGKIIYENTGRVTDTNADDSARNFINDAAKGTVEFKGSANASDLTGTSGGPLVKYYNLKITGSGTYMAAAALTVNHDLTQNAGTLTANNTLSVGNDLQSAGTLTANGAVTVGNDLTQSAGTLKSNANLTVTNALAVSGGGNVYFNNGTGNSTTTINGTAAFSTTGSVSLGNTAGDAFTVASALNLPSTIAISPATLTLAGTITATGDITLGHNTTLNANTTFESAAELKTPVVVSTNSPAHSNNYTLTTNKALSSANAANTLTIQDANFINYEKVTASIIFTETLAATQSFIPYAGDDAIYTSVKLNKEHSGSLFVEEKLKTKTLDITKNQRAEFKRLVTVTEGYTDSEAAGDIIFHQGCSFTNATAAAEFKTKGKVTLNGSGDAAPCAFAGGLKHTEAEGSTELYGALNAPDKNIELGTTTLGANTTINVNAGTGSVTLGALDGAHELASNGSGLLTFGGIVGGTTPPTQVTAAGSALFNAAANVNGPVTIAGDGEFKGVTNVDGNIAITGNAVINGDTTTTNSGQITVGANAAINAATTSATTITVEGTTTVSGPSITSGGLQLYKGDLTFAADCTVTGTVQAAANVATSAAVTATFANDVWLYSSLAAALGGAGGSLAITENLFFVGKPKAISVNSNVTAKNVLLLHGTVDIAAAATLASSTGDIIMLGAAYDINDDKDGAASSQVAELFAYNHTSRKKAASYTAAFPTVCPDGTDVLPGWSGAVTTNAGAKISAGQNFYANGLSSLGSGAWTLLLQNNERQDFAFAEVYNSTITNCTASPIGGSGTVYLAAAENNTVSGCSANIVTSRPVIAQAWTVYDDVVYVSFKDSITGNPVAIENSCNEISAAAASIFHSSVAFDGTFIDADCQTSTNGKDDLSAFYIKADSGHKWNTDATGIFAGDDGSAPGHDASVDRSGARKETIPCLNLPKALDSLYESLRDSSKNRIAHYYNGHTFSADVLYPDTSAVNAAPGKTFTDVADHCAPVLIKVLTGQELHESPASQKDYDAHNFVEFVYSEPVSTSGGSTTVLDSDVNIQAGADLGASTNNAGGITFAGLASAANGEINASLKSGGGSPHALYRNFSTTADGAAYAQASRIRVSIAGWVDGTISAYGKSYKNWAGYITSATCPSGTITRIANANIKDKSPNTNSLDSISTDGHPFPTLTVENSESELYGTWDTTAPSLAPIRINKTNTWERPATDGSQEYEIVGASYDKGTLSAIELHWFDNEPTYSESRQWFSRVGWADASSPTEYASIVNYAADVRGGSRPDNTGSNVTKGGIRYCSIYDANSAFTYAVDGTSDYYNFSKQIIAGAESSLFTYAGDAPGAQTHATGAEDGLYCKLTLDQTSYKLQTTFLMTFDSNACFITDLAGNRIQCGLIKIKSIDRTPPAFTMTAVPLGTKQMMIIFSKALNTDSLILYKDANDHETVPALEYIPKSLFLTDSSGTGIQIDQSVPAKCLFKTKNATGLLFALSQNAVLNDITKGVFVTAKSVTYTYDPLAGVTAPITFIQDATGNYVVGDSAHALSDFAVNAIEPQYAYDNSLTDDGPATGYSLYQEGSWAVRDWNAEQANYGTISSNKEIIVQTSLYDGTSDKSGGYDKTQTSVAFFSAAPTAASVSTEINRNTEKSWRIWLPNYTNDIFGSLAPANNTTYAQIQGSANDSGMMFDIPKETSSSNWKSGDQVSFVFKLGNYTVDHFADGTQQPLYAVRLKDLNDITSLDLWSFKIRTTTLQRGGVTILNNVIDVDNGENTVVQVDMKESGNLNVIVMTLDGNIIKYLRHGHTDAGTHYYNWNGTNNGGSKVARGLYFVRVIGPGIDETRKVMCVKQ